MNQSIREFARQVITAEAAAVTSVARAIDDDFERAVALILNCKASLLLTGIGKAGHIARKLSATFASTGTPSHFLSPGDSLHGDLGSIRDGDIVLVLSASGESDEVLALMNVVKMLNHPVIAITCRRNSGLGKHANIVLEMGEIEEAGSLGLAPSSTTTAMLALGDALALTVSHERKFTAEDFAVFHPAGQLGRKLLKVKEAMTFKLGENLPVASDRLTVGQVLHEVSALKRRSGAVILTDEAGRLSGLFSDGDLRRLITEDQQSALARAVRDVMTRNPKRIDGNALASEAVAVMHAHRIDELPVIDDAGKPVGLIDVQDLVVLKMLDSEAGR